MKALFPLHPHKPQCVLFYWGLLLLLVALVNQPAHAALWEKRYPVKTFGDQRILCDPYQVKPGDWLHKIFLNRGELAEYNFKTFSRIFKQLNPQVTHINRINSGDWILIPLKRLSPKTPMNAPSGNLTIPFSSLKDRPVSTHTVVAGDRVSNLLMKRCGPTNSSAYKTCLALLQQLNPAISDFNRIYPGQTLKLPGLSKKTGPGKPAYIKNRRARYLKADITPLFPEKLNSKLLLQVSRLAQVIQTKFKGRGKYHFPQINGGVTRVNLGESPLLQFKNGDRFLLIPPNLPTEINSDAVLRHWPKATLVPLTTETPDIFYLLDTLSKNLDPAHYRTTLELATSSGQVTLTAPWLIMPNKGTQDGSLLIPQGSIPNPEIAVELGAFCRNARVVLHEITAEGASIRQPKSSAATTKLNQIEIKPAPLKVRLKQLAFELGISYRSNITIKFPYGGVFVESVTDALEDTTGRLCLVDNGQFAGQSIAAIKQSGLEVVSFQTGKTLYDQMPQLLTKLQIPYKIDPEITLLDATHLDVRLKLDGLMINRPQKAPLVILARSLDKQLQPLLATMQTKVLLLTPNKKESEQ